jgi:hypothetical protein
LIPAQLALIPPVCASLATWTVIDRPVGEVHTPLLSSQDWFPPHVSAELDHLGESFFMRLQTGDLRERMRLKPCDPVAELLSRLP